ncbi:Pro-kumamolisin, activation domain-containing protein [Lasiosphaeria ovina]|uniref:Pro-kumamolisin, activation domain-containing protein n=1 Tax=Lasiosphaeria ovina TaxID=92902 RepID=A0AAE0K7G7_9PEZI|nr:Pro-kumamolisin, activation domain-containing protein [Lasiosphaeria ovina]
MFQLAWALLNGQLPFKVALQQQNLHLANDGLLKVSEPQLLTFGRYYKLAELIAQYAPAREFWVTVRAWLSESGIPASRIVRSHDANCAMFDTTVGEAEALLQTRHHMYTAEANGGLHPHQLRLTHNPLGSWDENRAASQQRPTHGKGYTTSRRIPAPARPRGAHSCLSLITPDCLRAMYGLPSNHNGHPNVFGIYEQAWVSWLPGDPDTFFATYAPALISRRTNIVEVDGGYWQTQIQDFAFNADLDFEYAMALANPQPANMINYQVGDVSGQVKLNGLLATFNPFYCGPERLLRRRVPRPLAWWVQRLGLRYARMPSECPFAAVRLYGSRSA